MPTGAKNDSLTNVIARSACDEAIQARREILRPATLDCFGQAA
jgi:hypothetical protein